MDYAANGAVSDVCYWLAGDPDSIVTHMYYDSAIQLVKAECVETYDGSLLVNEFYWENGNVVAMRYDYIDNTSSKMQGKKKAWPGFSGLLKASGRNREKAVPAGWDPIGFEYSSEENKTNLDLSFLLAMMSYGLNDYSDLLGVFGFYGKMNKNLPDRTTEDSEIGEVTMFSMEYEKENSGLLQKITVKGTDISDPGTPVAIGTITFTY